MTLMLRKRVAVPVLDSAGPCAPLSSPNERHNPPLVTTVGVDCTHSPRRLRLRAASPGRMSRTLLGSERGRWTRIRIAGATSRLLRRRERCAKSSTQQVLLERPGMGSHGSSRRDASYFRRRLLKSHEHATRVFRSGVRYTVHTVFVANVIMPILFDNKNPAIRLWCYIFLRIICFCSVTTITKQF